MISPKRLARLPRSCRKFDNIMAEEETIWTGRPSQVKNLKVFIACVLIVPLPYAFWKWLEIRCFHYELTNQRLKTTRGVLNKQLDELELYRVKDTSFEQSFFLRMFGLGDVVLLTSDRSTPELRIEAIPDALDVREKIRTQVEMLRDTKRVREIDFE